MKAIYFIFILLSSITLFSQKDIGDEAAQNLISNIDSAGRTWSYGLNTGLYVSQVSFLNWSAGGVSSVSAIIKSDVFTNYLKNKNSWENTFQAEWGMIKSSGELIQKNIDYFEINSKYGKQIDKKGKIFLGGLLKLRSQFTMGVTPGDSIYSTNFFAPANLILAIGINYKPKGYFSFFFSPVAGKFTFVTDKGVDGTIYGLEPGKDFRNEFGAYLKADFNKEIFNQVNLKSTLTLFNNYLDSSQDTLLINGIQEYHSKRANIDVDFSVGLDLNFNNWLTINVSTQLIYDHDIDVNLTEKDGITPVLNIEGEQKTGPRTQFTESLNIGVVYRFKQKEANKEPVK